MSAAQAAPPAAAAPEGGDPVAPAPPKEGKSVSSWSTKKLLYTLRVANMSNGLLLVLTGILVFITGMVNVTFSTITVSGYVVFFGMLMTCLECNIGNLAPRFKRNFGFLFSFIGRTVFIIFCSTMCFALNAWLGYLAGAVTAVNGLFNGYVICVHPSFKTGELSAKSNPFGGYTGGESEMLSYLKSNPALANKVGTAAIGFAKDNPQVALSVASAATAQPAESNPWAPK